jgi:hypothetical protein
LSRLKLAEERFYNIELVCQSCTLDHNASIACESIDCPVLFERKKATDQVCILKNDYKKLEIFHFISFNTSKTSFFPSSGNKRRTSSTF